MPPPVHIGTLHVGIIPRYPGPCPAFNIICNLLDYSYSGAQYELDEYCNTKAHILSAGAKGQKEPSADSRGPASPRLRAQSEACRWR